MRGTNVGAINVRPAAPPRIGHSVLASGLYAQRVLVAFLAFGIGCGAKAPAPMPPIDNGDPEDSGVGRTPMRWGLLKIRSTPATEATPPTAATAPPRCSRAPRSPSAIRTTGGTAPGAPTIRTTAAAPAPVRRARTTGSTAPTARAWSPNCGRSPRPRRRRPMCIPTPHTISTTSPSTGPTSRARRSSLATRSPTATADAGQIALYESGSDPYGAVWLYEARGCSTGVVHDLRTPDMTYIAIARAPRF